MYSKVMNFQKWALKLKYLLIYVIFSQAIQITVIIALKYLGQMS